MSKKIFITLLICIFCSVSLNSFAEISIKFIKGSPHYQKPNSEKWYLLRKEHKLRTNYIIKTSNRDLVELNIDGNTVKINRNTIFQLSTDQQGDKRINLTRGSIFAKMDKLKSQNKGFSINTLTSTCAVRGTEFTTMVGYDGTTLLQVIKGQVALYNEKTEILVGQNQQSIVKFGENPQNITIIKKVDWERWLSESRQNLKGNEQELLKICYQKMATLNQEITNLENIKKKLEKDKIKLKKQCLEAKEKNNKQTAQKKLKLYREADRLSIHALSKIYYKTYNIIMLKDFSDSIRAESTEFKDNPFLLETNKIFMQRLKYIRNIKAIPKDK